MKKQHEKHMKVDYCFSKERKSTELSITFGIVENPENFSRKQ